MATMMHLGGSNPNNVQPWSEPLPSTELQETSQEGFGDSFKNFGNRVVKKAKELGTPQIETNPEATAAVFGSKILAAVKKVYTPFECLKPKMVEKTDRKGNPVLDKEGNPVMSTPLKQMPLKVLHFNDKIGSQIARQIDNALGCFGKVGHLAAIVLGAVARALTHVVALAVEVALAGVAALLAGVAGVVAIATSPVWTPFALLYLGVQNKNQGLEIEDLKEAVTELENQAVIELNDDDVDFEPESVIALNDGDDAVDFEQGYGQPRVWNESQNQEPRVNVVDE